MSFGLDTGPAGVPPLAGTGAMDGQGMMSLMKRRPWNAKRGNARQTVPIENEASLVKLMPEYLCELPLWGRSWQSLKLPAPLLNRLADWPDYFDDNFDAFSGWKTPEARSLWEGQSIALIKDLKAALKGVELTVDLWPLRDSELT